jgi:hypothetical protein
LKPTQDPIRATEVNAGLQLAAVVAVVAVPLVLERGRHTEAASTAERAEA